LPQWKRSSSKAYMRHGLREESKVKRIRVCIISGGDEYMG
jgi:hypothetical protein